jgi:hypothetical protein
MRKISVDYNKFIAPPAKLADPTDPKKYKSEVEIDLNELSRQYIIEEFDEHLTTCSASDYIDLRFLRKTTNLFKFRGGHPGSAKDSRKERSRVMGQTMTRYFLHEFLNAKYVANVSTFLNKDLGSKFGNYKLIRTKDGDTPDFICANNSSDIFLAEAKGRRTDKTFSDPVFTNARNQFKRVKIEKGGKAISLDGYIGVFIIANENNGLYNSKLLLEDPATEGEAFIESNDLLNLVKMGHYCELLTKMGLGFIGESLLSNDSKLFEDKFPFQIFTYKGDSQEYIGMFLSPQFQEDRFFHPIFFDRGDRYLNSYLKRSSKYFIGINRQIFETLLSVARGNTQAINEIKLTENQILNGITCKYADGIIISDSYLMDYKGSYSL